MADPGPLVSIVVVTLNGREILRRCLRSLAGQDYHRREIILVDNGSTEDIRSLVQQEFPEVRLVRLPTNCGFAAGNNAGIQVAQGAYVALINNDAVASSGWIRSMVAAAEADPRIGAVASIILDGNAPGVLDSCGVGVALDGMSRQAMMGRTPPVLTAPCEVLVPSGCACLFRKPALDEVGLFDESFFAYCEDTDLGLRLRRAGWRAVAAPGAVVTHYYSMTAGKYSLQKVFWVERNHVWLAVKNFPFILLLLAPLATIWRHLVQVSEILRGHGWLDRFVEHAGFLPVAWTILRAQFAAAAGLPGAVARRRAFRTHVRLGSIETCRLLFRFRLTARQIVLGESNARH